MSKWPQIKNTTNCNNKLLAVLLSEHWTIRSQYHGHKYLTEEFEEKWAKFCDKKYALTVSSGSSAIEICLRALNIKEEDEVIVPSLGWYATAAAVVRVGATPVFCDVKIDTTCIDAEKVKLLITPKTKVIIAVHLHCSFASILELKQLCDENDIILLEDSAQAHGGKYSDNSLEYSSLATCYSFNQEKLIPSGEGGAIVTNDEELYKRAYAIRTDGYNNYGKKGWQPSGFLGSNFAISEFQSAVLLSSFEEFSYFNKIRLKNAKKIYSALKNIEEVNLIHQPKEISHPFYYEIGITFSEKILSNIRLDKIIKIMNKTKILKVTRTDQPTPENPLFKPYFKNTNYKTSFSNAKIIYNTMIVFHHKYLLIEGIEEVLLNAIKEVIHVSYNNKLQRKVNK